MTIEFDSTFPDEIKMTMKVTMTLAAWKEIMSAIPNTGSWGNADVFRDEISRMVDHASKHFYSIK